MYKLKQNGCSANLIYVDNENWFIGLLKCSLLFYFIYLLNEG